MLALVQNKIVKKKKWEYINYAIFGLGYLFLEKFTFL
jgi:hypothetical protein